MSLRASPTRDRNASTNASPLPDFTVPTRTFGPSGILGQELVLRDFAGSQAGQLGDDLRTGEAGSDVGSRRSP